jgi:hypothetical protein
VRSHGLRAPGSIDVGESRVQSCHAAARTTSFRRPVSRFSRSLLVEHPKDGFRGVPGVPRVLARLLGVVLLRGV